MYIHTTREALLAAIAYVCDLKKVSFGDGICIKSVAKKCTVFENGKAKKGNYVLETLQVVGKGVICLDVDLLYDLLRIIPGKSIEIRDNKDGNVEIVHYKMKFTIGQVKIVE